MRRKHGGKDKRMLVLDAEVNLVDIIIQSDAFSFDYKYKVIGVFCHVDFYLHKADPSSVPMFRDLMGQSKHCQQEKIKFDLYTIVEDAREYDAQHVHNASHVVHTIEPTGFIFHESRCGSTLVANSLVAMDPVRNRVYSESDPPLAVAKAAANGKRAVKLLQDVIYMMGRSNVPMENRLFFKIQSIGTKNMSIFRESFPGTPWIFVYRDPVQVMMSHLKVKGKSKAVCLRSRRQPPNDLKSMIKMHGDDISSVSNEEFCAAHLVSS